MKKRMFGLFLVLAWAISALGAGCGPYHRRGGMVMEVDIHSQAYRDQHYGRHTKYDHWGPDGKWDDNGYWKNHRWYKKQQAKRDKYRDDHKEDRKDNHRDNRR